MKHASIIDFICLVALSLLAVSCQEEINPARPQEARAGISVFSCVVPDECEPAVRAELGTGDD